MDLPLFGPDKDEDAHNLGPALTDALIQEVAQMLPAVARGPHSLGSTLLLARPREVTITVRSLSARVVMYSGWVAVMCQVNVRNKNIRTVQTRSTGTLQTLTLIPPFLLQNEIPMDYVLT